MADRPQDPLLVDSPGATALLLGNEAIVRGAIEAGVAFASGYPGTPSSEVTDSFARIAATSGIAFEYSINEKVAVEMAFAASLAGARAICAMKHLGLMYAGDPMSTIPYVGPGAGLVIVSAGDPSCRTSPNEQDQRYLGPMLHLPVLDPATPAEALAMARFAFELSEHASLPVLLRPTTRVCHSRAVVEFGPIQPRVVTGFKRDPRRLVPIPVNARPLRLSLEERMERARGMIAKSDFFSVRGDGRSAVLTSGSPAATCVDLLTELGALDAVKLLTVGAVHPWPEAQIAEALTGVERLLVVEELSPFLEDKLLALCARRGLSLQVLGKRTDHLPVPFELEPEQIQRALHAALQIGHVPKPTTPAPPAPPRPPVLCPGCPHRTSHHALRTVFGTETLYFNDIGCYTLGYGPPLQTADALLCMGAGFTLAAGVSRMTGQRTVGIVGDSTFFHSGIPGLINAVKERANMVAVVLDNQVTAMTGFQESPTVHLQGADLSRQLSIAGIARALGIESVETVDPHDLPVAIAALERARRARGVAVVIMQRECPTYMARAAHLSTGVTFTVDRERCQVCSRPEGCRTCPPHTGERFQRHMALSRALETQRPAPATGVAPCAAECPLGLCVQGYVGYVAAGQHREAWEMIARHVVLPEAVCRVCHRPCEAVCVRAEIDAPVAINDLKRFVVAQMAQEGAPYDPPRDPDHAHRVAVVGAGPSGLAAAHDLRLRGFAVTLYDAADRPGGLLASGIPPYRLPADALKRDVARLMELGIDFVGDTLLGRDLGLAELLAQGNEAVYLAIGAHQGYGLGLAGEDVQGAPEVVDALRFLKELSTTSATAMAGKRVVVIGGGNSALDAARAARRLGATQVTIAYRRSRTEMPGLHEEIDAVEEEGIALRTLLQPVRLDPGGLVCVRTELGEPDASGRRRPVPVEGSDERLDADEVIAAVGQAPETGWIAESQTDLSRHPDGSLEVDPMTRQTSHPRIFAGGDAVWGPRTVTDAIAQGRRAAWGIDRLVRGADEADRQLPPPLPHAWAAAELRGLARADRAERAHPLELDPGPRAGHFDEVRSTLDESEAQREAERCLTCGTCGQCRACVELLGCPAFFVVEGGVQIDPTLCTGCGVCVAICPNRAIHEVATTTEADEAHAPGVAPEPTP